MFPTDSFEELCKKAFKYVLNGCIDNITHWSEKPETKASMFQVKSHLHQLRIHLEDRNNEMNK